MSERAAANLKPIQRGRLTIDRPVRIPHGPDAYNRSSLAIDLEPSYEDEFKPMPRLVPAPAGNAEAVAGVPTFMGLDAATRRKDPAAKVISAVIHVVAFAGILWLGFTAHKAVVASVIETPVNITLYAPPPPPKILPVAPKPGGGGGGGAHEVIPPTRGNPPKVVTPRRPVVAPQILRIDHPKLAAEPTEIVKMPDNPKLPNLGVADSPQVALASQGKGSGSGFGSGLGGGIGMGRGVGAGAGSGGGYGGGVMSVGGGVSAPVVIHSVEPEFTEAARQANFEGSVAIQLIVDQQGNPQNVHITRSGGMGMDEKAIEAVRQYRFRPAMFQGHPVAVQIIIDVAFHLH